MNSLELLRQCPLKIRALVAQFDARYKWRKCGFWRQLSADRGELVEASLLRRWHEKSSVKFFKLGYMEYIKLELFPCYVQIAYYKHFNDDRYMKKGHTITIWRM